MRRFVYVSFVTLAFVVGYSATGSAQLGRTSTTDYLVRVEALSYLEEQNALRAQLIERLKAADAQVTTMSQPEIEKWNRTIADAEKSLAEVVKAEEFELEVMKEAYERDKINLAEQIKEKEEELANLRKPKGLTGMAMKMGANYFNNMLWGTTPEQQKILDIEAQKSLNKEIAVLQVSLKDLETSEPSRDKVILPAELLMKRQESLDAIDDAQVALDNLKKSARIMGMKRQMERLRAHLESIDKSGMCMAKLAKCKGVSGWDTLSGATQCKIKNLEKAKKATNPKCKALTTKSSWVEVDQCIPEYRREILKKPGTEGSRKQFDACRRM